MYFALIGFLVIEILIIAFTLVFGNNCGSACDPHSIFNPFGIEEPTNSFKLCTMNCVWHPHTFFHTTFDIFILTLIIYIAVLIIGKKFTSHNSVYEVQDKVR